MIVFLILVFCVALLGFYTATDVSRLENSQLLEGSDYVGYSICHRITDRSFTIAGRQMPLCARCTGIYLGVTLTFVVLALAGRRRWSQLPPLRIMLILVGFVVLMGIDGINSYSHFFEGLPHLYEPQNWLRLITGTGAGLAMGLILFPALSQTLWREQIQRPALGSVRELAGIIFLAGVLIAMVLSNQPTILYVLGLASAAGVIIALMSINGAAVLILTQRDARVGGWRQAILPLSVGLALAVLQIGVISFVRFSATGTMTGFPGI
jgi:uncharacterized membrane protein